MLPSAAEVAEGAARSDLSRDLWIGVWCLAGEDFRSKGDKPSGVASPHKKLKGLNVHDVAFSNPAAIQHGPHDLRVCVKLEAGDMLQFFVLVYSDEQGICDVMGVRLEDVFFFEKYRNDALTSNEARRVGWPHIIKDHLKQRQ